MVRLVSRMDRESCPAQQEVVRPAAPQGLLRSADRWAGRGVTQPSRSLANECVAGDAFKETA
jgi:hypothetical protein